MSHYLCKRNLRSKFNTLFLCLYIKVVPPWHSGEHHSVPDIIYTHPPKGHPSAFLHGAPVHETYGPGPGHEHFEPAWENSGPGLGSE